MQCLVQLASDCDHSISVYRVFVHVCLLVCLSIFVDICYLCFCSILFCLHSVCIFVFKFISDSLVQRFFIHNYYLTCSVIAFFGFLLFPEFTLTFSSYSLFANPLHISSLIALSVLSYATAGIHSFFYSPPSLSFFFSLLLCSLTMQLHCYLLLVS